MSINTADTASMSIKLNKLKEKVLDGKVITKEEAFFLVTADLTTLSEAADEIRTHFWK